MMTCLEGFVSQLLLHKVYFIQDGAILRKGEIGGEESEKPFSARMC